MTLKWVKELNPSEVVLSDKLFDRDETIKRSKAFLIKLQKLRFEGKTMAVPQGANAAEWFECLESFRYREDVHTIGVFLKAGSLFPEGREDLLNRVKQLKRFGDKNWHLLGSDTMLWELQRIPHLPVNAFIRSMDTTKFITCGYAGVRVQDVMAGTATYPERQQDYFRLPFPEEKILEIIDNNLNVAEQLLRKPWSF